MQKSQLRDFIPLVWLVHALYFIVGGLWSVVGIRSFQKVSGPKTDLWLVRTVGGLIVVVGGVIAWAGVRRRITPELIGMAVGSSAVLAVIDVVYTLKGRISRVYLLDACANSVLVVAWLAAVKQGLLRRQRGPELHE